MKMNNKFKALTLAVLMLFTVSMLCACQNGSGTTTTTQLSKTAVYRVTVLGVDGNPASDGVIVRFLQDGEEIALQKTDASGVASKELSRGDYTVEIMFIDDSVSYYYDTTDLTLSANKTELTIALAYDAAGNETQTIFDGNQDCVATHVGAGATFVTLEPGVRNYFLFTPAESGVYKLSTAGDGYVVGYFGSPHYVQAVNAGNAEGNATTVTVSPDMIGTDASGTTVFVIGVDNPTDTQVKVMLMVERVSAYVETSIPSQTYVTTGSLAPWTLPEGASTMAFDLKASTDTYKLVLDEATGFYHIGSVDGPLVLVCLGEASNGLLNYMVSYDTVLQTVGVNKYFTDEEGNYTHSENYVPCLLDYIGLRDDTTGNYTGGCVDRASGLYPLTEDLMYIIQQHGDYSGWWDTSRDNYLFRDDSGAYDLTINTEIAWLFMCVYMQG